MTFFESSSRSTSLFVEHESFPKTGVHLSAYSLCLTIQVCPEDPPLRAQGTQKRRGREPRRRLTTSVVLSSGGSRGSISRWPPLRSRPTAAGRLYNAARGQGSPVPALSGRSCSAPGSADRRNP
jgi:hypothetical protein